MRRCQTKIVFGERVRDDDYTIGFRTCVSESLEPRIESLSNNPQHGCKRLETKSTARRRLRGSLSLFLPHISHYPLADTTPGTRIVPSQRQPSPQKSPKITMIHHARINAALLLALLSVAASLLPGTDAFSPVSHFAGSRRAPSTQIFLEGKRVIYRLIVSGQGMLPIAPMHGTSAILTPNRTNLALCFEIICLVGMVLKL
jgi:hypothetical protein